MWDVLNTLTYSECHKGQGVFFFFKNFQEPQNFEKQNNEMAVWLV